MGIENASGIITRDTAVNAGSILVDSYEDGDLAEYATRSVSVVDQANVTPSAIDGLKMVEVPGGGDNGFTSANGLPAYPSAGDTWRMWQYWTGSIEDTRVYWACQSEVIRPSNTYAYIYETGEGGSDLDFDVDGSNIGAITDAGLTTGNWYCTETDWGTGGTIDVRILDINENQLGSTLSVSDSTYTSGGIGCYQDAGAGTKYMDNWVII